MDRINDMIADGEYLEVVAVILGSLTASLIELVIKAVIFWMVGRWIYGF